jgi:two-component sensor histidine kinase
LARAPETKSASLCGPEGRNPKEPSGARESAPAPQSAVEARESRRRQIPGILKGVAAPADCQGWSVARSGLNFELSLEPNPRMVSIVRRFVEETFEKLVGDPDAIFRISMAAHELLENGAKYAVGRRAVLRVVLEEKETGASAHIAITNETTKEHVERLRARISEIAETDDPFGLYQTLMRRSSKIREESGLGLARIRAEGEMNLGLEVVGSTVTIVASAHVPGRKS